MNTPPSSINPKLIDFTLLKPDATDEDIIRLCQEAKTHGFYSVCVASSWVAVAKGCLRNNDVKVAAVVGFPHGNASTTSKEAETAQAVLDGADEIDMVINIGRVRTGDFGYVQREIHRVVLAANGAPVKVIFETDLLTGVQIVQCCEYARRGGATFVKTSTGFAPNGKGATVEHISLMRANISPEMEVKASGGVRTPEQMFALAAAGATRFGIGETAALALMNSNLSPGSGY